MFHEAPADLKTCSRCTSVYKPKSDCQILVAKVIFIFCLWWRLAALIVWTDSTQIVTNEFWQHQIISSIEAKVLLDPLLLRAGARLLIRSISTFLLSRFAGSRLFSFPPQPSSHSSVASISAWFCPLCKICLLDHLQFHLHIMFLAVASLKALKYGSS